MTYEARENSGTLSRNPDKDPANTSHAKWGDYKGECAVTCPQCNQPIKFWLTAWLKEGKTGRFLSLAFRPRAGRQDAQAPLPPVQKPMRY